jgi:arginase family enzyme
MRFVAEEIKRVIGDHPCYLTFDTDCIDCGEMPGTTLPEPFGLFGREVRDLIRNLYDLNIVGADIMELAPVYDPTGKSACLASGIAFELFCLLAHSKYRKTGEKQRTHWK